MIEEGWGRRVKRRTKEEGGRKRGKVGEEGGKMRVHIKSVHMSVPCDGAINIGHHDLVSVVPEIQCALGLSGTLHRLPWQHEMKDNINTEELLEHD